MRRLTTLLCVVFLCFVLGRFIKTEIERGYPLPVAKIPSHPVRQRHQKAIHVVVLVQDQPLDRVFRALRSVITQQHSSYVVHVEDLSGDPQVKEALCAFFERAPQRAPSFVNSLDPATPRLQVLQESVGDLPSDAIVLYLDSDNYLAHEQVLCDLNKAYQDPCVWVTVGTTYLHSSCMQRRFRRLPISYMYNNHVFREIPREYSPFITCYAGLLQRTFSDTVPYSNVVASLCADPLWIIPVLEMARSHIYYIHKVAFMQQSKTCIHSDAQTLEYLSKQSSCAPVKTPFLVACDE